MDGVLTYEFYVCSIINPIRDRFLKNVRDSDQIPTEIQH